MKEIWKYFRKAEDTIKGPKNDWEVSNFGRVRKNGQVIELKLSNSGYYCCHGAWLVHRIVAETFIDKIPKGYVVDHIDGNRLNNRVDNLKICTQKENVHNPISYNIMLESRNTDEYKKNQSDIHKGKLKGTIHINNGEIEKLIFPEEFEKYSNEGFMIGCLYDKYIKLKETCRKKRLQN